MHPPQLEPLLQGIRYGSRINVVAPECRVSPLRKHIMQLEEFDHALPVVVERFIELLREYVHCATRPRQTICNRIHRDLNEHQGGRFERFQEASRETYGNAIVFPEGLSMAGIDVEFTGFQIVRRGSD